MNSPGFLLALLCLWTGALVLSAVGASNPFTWALEVAPAILGVAALAATYRRFPFSWSTP
jgi:putative membrane protein